MSSHPGDSFKLSLSHSHSHSHSLTHSFFIQVVYEEYPSWTQDISLVKSFDQLPIEVCAILYSTAC